MHGVKEIKESLTKNNLKETNNIWNAGAQVKTGHKVSVLRIEETRQQQADSCGRW